MPSVRINVPITPAAGIGAGADITLVAGNALNHKALNQVGSRVLVLVVNHSGSPITATLKEVVQTVHADDIATSVPDGKTYVFGPCPASLYTQPSGDELGYIQVNLSAFANVDLYAISF
jgi:uncharacterized protein YbjT (DUF2867 family)